MTFDSLSRPRGADAYTPRGGFPLGHAVVLGLLLLGAVLEIAVLDPGHPPFIVEGAPWLVSP